MHLIKTTHLIKIISGTAVSLLVSGAGAASIADTLHGSAAEAQAVNEMTMQIQEAFAQGEVAACGRAGGNMAKYGVERRGEALIREDQAKVQASSTPTASFTRPSMTFEATIMRGR